MPYKATIKAGQANVVVGGRGPFQAGETVFLTDQEFAAMQPAVFATIFTAAPAAVNSATASPYA